MARPRILQRTIVATLAALLLGLLAPAAWAQPRPPNGTTSTTTAPTPAANPSPPEEVAPDSPRASVRLFVELSRAGEFAEAARFLDLPPGSKVDGAGLARRLKGVLDRHLLGDGELALLASPFSSGNTADKLPPGVDELGAVPGPKGPEPVRLVKRPNGTWVFSRGTVEQIDKWYARLSERWLFDALPEPLLRPGPFDILYWQYLALPLLVIGAWLVGRVLGFLTRKVIAKVVARTGSRWDDALVQRIGPPLTLAWGLGAFALLVPWLGLYEPARDAVQNVIRAGFLVALFWAGLRAIDVTKTYLMDTTTAARAVAPLAAQFVKLLVFAAAAIAVLSQLGFPVASLIAGLGIGGIAIALAAQKTVENLFGSLSIGVDQPFRVGDFVKVEDVVGTVEVVGLRSTRIRTLDRTLVTIPNGKLADMRVESFTVRDRFRLNAVLGLVYGTTAAQLRAVVAGIDEALRAEPTFFTEGHMIVVRGFGASSIEVEVMAWFQTKDWNAFTEVRQDVLLRFMEVVERNGTAFAFPTQTVHVVGGSDEPRDPRRGSDRVTAP